MQKINIKELLRLQRDGLSVRPLHFILGNKNLEKIGEIVNIPIDTVTYHPQFNGSDELDFTVYKKKDGKVERYWDKIVDFKSFKNAGTTIINCMRFSFIMLKISFGFKLGV